MLRGLLLLRNSVNWVLMCVNEYVIGCGKVEIYNAKFILLYLINDCVVGVYVCLQSYFDIHFFAR